MSIQVFLLSTVQFFVCLMAGTGIFLPVQCVNAFVGVFTDLLSHSTSLALAGGSPAGPRVSSATTGSASPRNEDATNATIVLKARTSRAAISTAGLTSSCARTEGVSGRTRSVTKKNKQKQKPKTRSVMESLIARMEATRWNIVTATSRANLPAGRCQLIQIVEI